MTPAAKEEFILVCGCFGGRGFSILQEWVTRARNLGVPTYLVTELYPVGTRSNPQEIRDASYKALHDPRVVGVIFVFLTYETLQLPPSADRTGGLGVERGIVLDMELQQKRKVGLLFEDIRDVESERISSLLRPGKRELVFWAENPGDLEDLFIKFINLALSLLEVRVQT